MQAFKATRSLGKTVGGRRLSIIRMDKVNKGSNKQITKSGQAGKSFSNMISLRKAGASKTVIHVQQVPPEEVRGKLDFILGSIVRRVPEKDVTLEMAVQVGSSKKISAQRVGCKSARIKKKNNNSIDSSESGDFG